MESNSQDYIELCWVDATVKDLINGPIQVRYQHDSVWRRTELYGYNCKMATPFITGVGSLKECQAYKPPKPPVGYELINLSKLTDKNALSTDLVIENLHADDEPRWVYVDTNLEQLKEDKLYSRLIIPVIPEGYEFVDQAAAQRSPAEYWQWKPKLQKWVECPDVWKYGFDKRVLYVRKSTKAVFNVTKCGVDLACYQVISEYYGDKKAKRSGVPYMNHINEGLHILHKLKASNCAKDAFCLHPILQDDVTLRENMDLVQHLHPKIIIVTMEYRQAANRGLCCYQVDNPDHIYLGPLVDVHNMLIADKVQNRKDFEKYHKGTHPKSAELDRYFRNWLRALNVTEVQYQQLISDI